MTGISASHPRPLSHTTRASRGEGGAALANRLGLKAAELPLFLGAGLMALGLLLIAVAVRRGRDFKPADGTPRPRAAVREGQG